MLFFLLIFRPAGSRTHPPLLLWLTSASFCDHCQTHSAEQRTVARSSRQPSQIFSVGERHLRAVEETRSLACGLFGPISFLERRSLAQQMAHRPKAHTKSASSASQANNGPACPLMATDKKKSLTHACVVHIVPLWDRALRISLNALGRAVTLRPVDAGQAGVPRSLLSSVGKYEHFQKK